MNDNVDSVVRRPWFCGTLKDKQLKSGRFRGGVRSLHDGKFEEVATVYGDTLKIMRERKHAIVAMLNGEKPNAGSRGK